jgi:hypothetical protein
VSTGIATARGKLNSEVIATATELNAAAEEVAAGRGRAEVALRAALLKLNRRSKEYFKGVTLDMPWDWEQRWPLQRSAPRRIRTYDPRIRSPMLYPAELGARTDAIQVRGACSVK